MLMSSRHRLRLSLRRRFSSSRVRSRSPAKRLAKKRRTGLAIGRHCESAPCSRSKLYSLSTFGCSGRSSTSANETVRWVTYNKPRKRTRRDIVVGLDRNVICNLELINRLQDGKALSNGRNANLLQAVCI